MGLLASLLHRLSNSAWVLFKSLSKDLLVQRKLLICAGISAIWLEVAHLAGQLQLQEAWDQDFKAWMQACLEWTWLYNQMVKMSIIVSMKNLCTVIFPFHAIAHLKSVLKGKHGLKPLLTCFWDAFQATSLRLPPQLRENLRLPQLKQQKLQLLVCLSLTTWPRK